MFLQQREGFQLCVILKMTENAPSYLTIGTIEIAEMTEIVVNLFELEGIEKVRKDFIQSTLSWLFSKETAVSKAKNIFNLLDVNGDGKMKHILVLDVVSLSLI